MLASAVRDLVRARLVGRERVRRGRECDASAPPAMATLGLSKVFILDKYFTELQKFWETEKKLQGERARAPPPERASVLFRAPRVQQLAP